MGGFAIVDAPLDSSGAGRGEHRAPAARRTAGVVERLGLRDAGEADARIRDTLRDPDTGVLAAAEIRRASMAIAACVREVMSAGERPLVLTSRSPSGRVVALARRPRQRFGQPAAQLAGPRSLELAHGARDDGAPTALRADVELLRVAEARLAVGDDPSA